MLRGRPETLKGIGSVTYTLPLTVGNALLADAVGDAVCRSSTATPSCVLGDSVLTALAQTLLLLVLPKCCVLTVTFCSCIRLTVLGAVMLL